MNKDEAREAAKLKWLDSITTNGVPAEFSSRETAAFNAGFDADYDAGKAGEWRRIESEDDLPKPKHVVWVTRRSDGEVVRRTFDAPYSAEDFVELFSAWMPCNPPAPYQPEEQKQ